MSAPYTPTVTVSFAFGYGPFDVPSWTTPSHAKLDFVSAECDHGRSSEFDDFPPGRASIVYKDGARILDPSNASGPYYGQLLPRVPVKIVATISGTPYVRFYGFVDGWPLQNGRGQATVNITATDATKVLSNTAIPTSVYATAVIADSPVGYWRLGATTGNVAVDSSGNANDGTYTGVLERGAPSVLPFSADGAMKSVANDTGFVSLPESARLTSLPLSLEMWVQTDTKNPLQPFGARKRLYVQPQGDVSGMGFALDLGGDSDTDQFPILNYIDGTYNFAQSWAVDLNDGAPHHVVLTIDTGSITIAATALYVDGAVAATRATSFGGVTGLYTPYPSIGGASSDPDWVGRQDEMSLWDIELSDAQIAAHYTAGIAPWDGDSTGDRITRVLDLVGWPAGLRSIDNGEFSVGPAQIEGRSAWDYMRSIAASEQGRLFIAADGTLTFHERGRYFTETTETTSQFTFSDDGAGDGLHAGLNFNLDDRWIVNTATATRDGGSPQTAEDAGSKATYGPSEKSLTGLVLQHDRNARQLAEYLVFRYKDPQVRAETWNLQPELDATSWADIFGLEIGHRVTLECKPVNTGTQIVLDQHIERIHDSITPSSYTVEFNGSPPDPYIDDYFIFDGVGATQGFDAGIFR